MKRNQNKISITLLFISFTAYAVFVYPHISKKELKNILHQDIEEYSLLKWQTSTSYSGPNIYKKAIVKVKISEKEYYLLNMESGIDILTDSWDLPGVFMDYFPTELKKYNSCPKDSDIKEFLNECSYNVNGINELKLWLKK